MDWHQQREEDLNEHIKKDLELQKKLEDQLRVVDDEKNKEKLKNDIEEVKKQRIAHESEIEKVIAKKREALANKMSSVTFDEKVADLNEINKRIEELKQFEEGKSNLKIKKERLLQRTRREYQERHIQIERAIELFNTNSRFLYNAPGTLVIDVGDNGFRFRVDIRRDGSGGIDHMKVFCYDLMLAQLWSEFKRDSSPCILIHDSTIFDGVDERQVALALQLADRESRRCGFQYICTFNSDKIPQLEFPADFNFNSFVRLRLTDESEEGGLLGIRFYKLMYTSLFDKNNKIAIYQQ
ncbi:MAG: DUF2326 domain-containing protein [Rivularia sp. (in: cyanobacteria)]